MSRQAIAAIDEEMQKPSTVERGKRIAYFTNALEIAVDSAARFGLGEGVKRPRRPRATARRAR